VARAYTLRHAKFSLGEYQDAIEAYESGLELDPNNANMKTSLDTARSRFAEVKPSTAVDREPPRSASSDATGGMPDLSALASMMGGAGGGGGMPDLSSMMRNPQLMAM
jgi:small glutamine-rich tetratricopeptide repeat-containing protein alpha